MTTGRTRGPRVLIGAIAPIVLIIAVLVGAPAASGATASPPPQPTFVATSPMLTFGANGTVSTTVQVLNPGPRTQVRLALVLLPNCARVWFSKTATLSADGLTTLPLSFSGSFDTSSTAATLLMAPAADPITAGTACHPPVALYSSAPVGAAPTGRVSSSGGAAQPAPQAILLTLRRATTLHQDFWKPLLDGALFALVVSVLILAFNGKAPTFKNLGRPIFAGSTWNFKDSLATNVTAIGSLLGAGVAAAGATSALFPGVDMSLFALLSAFWGGAVALAPLALGLVSAKGKQTVKGQPATGAPFYVLIFATAITLTAAGAQIATLRVLVSLAATGDQTRTIVDVLLYGALVLAGAYVLSSTLTLVRSQPKDVEARHSELDHGEAPHSGLNHFAETSLAA